MTGEAFRQQADLYAAAAREVLRGFRSYEDPALGRHLLSGEPDNWWHQRLKLEFYAYRVLECASALADCDNDGERCLLTLRLGRYAGLVEAGEAHYATVLELETARKSTMTSAWKRQRERWDRVNALAQFIIKYGSVPPKIEFGKLNPARTRYFVRFKREADFDISVDTFNRDVERVSAEMLDFWAGEVMEEALYHFFESHAAAVCNASQSELMSLFEMFKEETGFDAPMDRLEWHAGHAKTWHEFRADRVDPAKDRS